MSDKETYRELSQGLHKTALAVHGMAVTQETHGDRLDRLEKSVTSNENSLQTRMARAEDRLKRLEENNQQIVAQNGTIQSAKIQGRATVAAAWVGGVFAIISALLALIALLK